MRPVATSRPGESRVLGEFRRPEPGSCAPAPRVRALFTLTCDRFPVWSMRPVFGIDSHTLPHASH
jgi:hypothetical protein